MSRSNAAYGRDWALTLPLRKAGEQEELPGAAPAPEDADIAFALDRWDEPEDVVVLDTETTGLGKSARILELSAALVRVPTGEVLDLRSQLIDPGRDPYTGRPIWIPPDVVAIHGITTQMVRGKPPVAEVLPKFVAWMQKGGRRPAVIAHNAPFDLTIIHEAMSGFMPWPRLKTFCTLKIARRVLKKGQDIADHKLGTLAGKLGVEVTGRHRGTPDVRTTAGVLCRLVARAHQTFRSIHGEAYEL